MRAAADDYMPNTYPSGLDAPNARREGGGGRKRKMLVKETQPVVASGSCCRVRADSCCRRALEIPMMVKVQVWL